MSDTINEKMIVFESDDWGAMRVNDKATFEQLKKLGFEVEKDPYACFDAIASKEDLTLLFELLQKFADRQGNHPEITANTIMANPCYSKIADADYGAYFYYDLIESFEQVGYGQDHFRVWQEGINAKVFYPQLHGREHLNVRQWLNALQQSASPELQAFNLGTYGIPFLRKNYIRNDYMAALDFNDKEEVSDHLPILQEAAILFEKYFQFKSQSFIAPCYTWSPAHEEALSKLGVKIIQGNEVQRCPGKGKKYFKKWHWFGQQNKFGQRYAVRNCAFEPSLGDRSKAVDICLKEIEMAFKFKQPAVVSVHRLNFIGVRDIKNRDQNLSLFQNLLSNIMKRWPEVKFGSYRNINTASA